MANVLKAYILRARKGNSVELLTCQRLYSTLLLFFVVNLIESIIQSLRKYSQA